MSGPIGTPNRSSGFAIALKYGTHAGTRLCGALG
jgi:hypothetical protein